VEPGRSIADDDFAKIVNSPPWKSGFTALAYGVRILFWEPNWKRKQANMDLMKSISDFVKLPPKFVVLVALVSGAVLFSPDWFLKKIHVVDIAPPFGMLTGLVFLFSTGTVVVNVVSYLAKRIRYRRFERKREETIQNKLHSLDHDEKSVIREFLLFGKTTIDLPMDNSTVAGLESSGVLKKVGAYGRYTRDGMIFSFSISDIAMRNLELAMLGFSKDMFEVAGNDESVNRSGYDWAVEHRPAYVKASRAGIYL
jgi:hypothetical protein